MNKLISQAFTPELLRSEGHKLIDMLADHLEKEQSQKSEPAILWKEPEEMYLLWKNVFENKTSDFHSIIKTALENSVQLHNPKYIGHQVSSPAVHIILSELAVNFLNNSAAVYEMGMSSAAIEQIVIEWAINAFNYGNKAGGILTSGGSLGGLTALLAARQKMSDYDVWEEGMSNEKNLTLFVSEEAHYSLARAAKILGFGNNVVKVPADNNLRMDIFALKEEYKKAIDQNLKPIAVIASACTTSTGSYDDINKIADFCEQHNLWLHVDGAHGAGVVLTEKYNHLVKGINRADSVVVDFHKMLLCPSLVTAVLFKNNEDSFKAFSQKASYLFESNEEAEWYNGGKRTIECTRKMMALKVFCSLKIYGENLFGDFIESRYNLAQDFAKLIHSQADFELALEPQSNIVCFRYVPIVFAKEKLSELNSEIRKALVKEGKFFIVKTIVRRETYLRITIMNPFTSITELEELLLEIRNTFALIKGKHENY